MNKPTQATTTRIREIPKDRQKVSETLQTVTEQEFDEVLILGWKDGKTYMHHSALQNTLEVIGALEVLKFRLQEK